MKKKTLKGFTLIELIIVMAVFSLIMVGALSLIDPVSSINKKASTNERTSAYVDNIQEYLVGSLQYSDNLWVYQGDDTLNTKQIAFDFKEAFYKNIVNTSDGTTNKYSKNKIRVMTIFNKDTTLAGVDFKKGQIAVQEVEYTSNDNAPINLSTPVKQLNDAYFNDKYNFDYILGQGKMVVDGGYKSLNSMEPDAAQDLISAQSCNSFALGIVLYKKDEGETVNSELKTATYDVIVDGSTTPPTTAPKDYSYRAYRAEGGVSYSIANIPLHNILVRTTPGKINRSYLVENGGKLEKYSTGTHSAFECEEDNISLNANDNITIVYSLCDEVNIAQ